MAAQLLPLVDCEKIVAALSYDALNAKAIGNLRQWGIRGYHEEQLYIEQLHHMLYLEGKKKVGDEYLSIDDIDYTVEDLEDFFDTFIDIVTINVLLDALRTFGGEYGDYDIFSVTSNKHSIYIVCLGDFRVYEWEEMQKEKRLSATTVSAADASLAAIKTNEQYRTNTLRRSKDPIWMVKQK